MTAESVLGEYGKNPIATLEKYKGHDVVFDAYLREVNSNLRRQLYVKLTLAADSPTFKDYIVVFVTSEEMVAGLKEYNVGDRVTVKVLFDQGVRHTLTGRGVSIAKKSTPTPLSTSK